MKWSHYKNLEELTEHDDAELDALKRRIVFAGLVVLFFMAIILGRLWFLQIYKGDEYRDRADNNRVRMREIVAPRGNILDSKGREMVTNRPSFNVVLVREDSNNVDELLKKLAVALDLDISELWEKLRDAEGKPRHIPVRLLEDVDWETLAYVENHNQEFPGIRVETIPTRVYHYENLAGHAIGYLGEISKKELAKRDLNIYTGGDLIGKSGLERLREPDLRGEKGSSSSEVNAKGFEQQLLKSEEPLPGNDIQLTLDAELQKVAEDLMAGGDKAGAVVAMEVKTGRMLVLASNPVLPLDQFVGGISHKNWNALLENPKHPLINKVVQAMYPPGSTYKMITAMAGLATGVINKDTVLYCPGHYYFGKRRYHCWKRGGHGAVNLKRAISESCDVYFYQVGLRVGVDRLAEYAGKFGLGHKSGIEMEHEKSGLTPTKDWKKKKYKRKWQEGETLSVAIGQGFNLATPLQICQMTATIANGGTQYRPQLIEKITDPDGNVLEQFEPVVVDELKGEKKFLRLIQDGMEEVVQGRRGTARKVRIKGLTIGGKTGTAQVVRLKQYKHLKEKDIPYKYRDHAWFTCYAPAEDPEIAVTVLVEHGLHGGSGAGPVARAMLEAYFSDRLQQAAEADKAKGE
ncbi:MAG TPA: penicillin-binding protein 2 [Desulfobacterales bacterium]|nr:penicillin-binding protein 2 [Desulfobacterales bacterium]HIP37818.1 penicillin-binding protein 2 [Desulfocapsa sulfexigens]